MAIIQISFVSALFLQHVVSVGFSCSWELQMLWAPFPIYLGVVHLVTLGSLGLPPYKDVLVIEKLDFNHLFNSGLISLYVILLDFLKLEFHCHSTRL